MFLILEEGKERVNVEVYTHTCTHEIERVGYRRKLWAYACTHDLNHMGPERVWIRAYTSELII